MMAIDQQSIKIRFGSAVRQSRLGKGLTQEELAFRAGLHRTYIADIERGVRNTSIVNIEKIAAALDISISDLLKLCE
jgi:transcriptional regulator with XRE-family HTH domain